MRLGMMASLFTRSAAAEATDADSPLERAVVAIPLIGIPIAGCFTLVPDLPVWLGMILTICLTVSLRILLQRYLIWAGKIQDSDRSLYARLPQDANNLFHSSRHQTRTRNSKGAMEHIKGYVNNANSTSIARNIIAAAQRGLSTHGQRERAIEMYLQCRSTMDWSGIPTGQVVQTFSSFCIAASHLGRASALETILQDMRRLKLPRTQWLYSEVLRALVSKRRYDTALALWAWIEEDEIEIEHAASMFTKIVKGFAKAGCVQEAFEAYKLMLEHRVEPESATCSALLRAFLEAGDADRALTLFADMAERSHRPDEEVFNNLLAGCAMTRNVEMGEKILSDMTSYSVMPSAATVSAMLRLYAEAEVLDRALPLLRGMEARFGLAPKQRLYTRLIDFCLRAEQWELVSEVLWEMCKLFGRPPEAELSKVVGACIHFFRPEEQEAILRKGLMPKVSDKDAEHDTAQW